MRVCGERQGALASGAGPCIRGGADAAAGRMAVAVFCSHRECEKCANTPSAEGAGAWALVIEGCLAAATGVRWWMGG